MDTQTVDDVETEEIDDIDAEIGELIDGANDVDDKETAKAEDAPEVIEDAPEVLDPLAPPDRWNQKFKDPFNALGGLQAGQPLPEGFDPRAVQQAWLDFHEDRQSYVTPLEQERAQLRSQLDRYNQVLAPYEQSWRMAGMTPEQGVSQLLAWSAALQQDPQTALRKLAQSYGVDINQMVDQQEWVPPEVADLRNQVDHLNNALTQFQTNAVSQQKYQQETAIEQQLTAFRTATDEHGNPKHPHYETLEPLMAGIYTSALQQVQRGALAEMPSLEAIYEQAAYAHPDIRNELMRSREEQEAAQKAAAAKKAASASKSVKSKGSGGGKAPEKSIEEEVGEIFDAQAA